MTPFGARVRALRAERGLNLRQFAAALQISPAYLSALEHGHRGLPSAALVVQICEYFNLIWDDYEDMQRLVRLSHPRVVVDSAGLDPAHTELANELARRIANLTPDAAVRLRSDLCAVADAAPEPAAPNPDTATGRTTE